MFPTSKDESEYYSISFDSLNEDIHSIIIGFLGRKSYATYGGINRICNELFDTLKLPKQTYIGTLPISLFEQVYEDKSLFSSSSSGCGTSKNMNKHTSKHHTNTVLYNDKHNNSTSGSNTRMYRIVTEGIICFNHIPLLNWSLKSLENNYDQLRWICLSASSAGKTKILQKVFEELKDDKAKKVRDKLIKEPILCRNATVHGHLETLQYLMHIGCTMNNNNAMSNAVLGGNLELVQWLYKRQQGDDHQGHCSSNNNSSYSHLLRNTGIMAVLRNNIKMMMWLRQNGYRWEGNECYHACRNGHIEMFQFLVANECPWDLEDCRGGARRSLLKCQRKRAELLYWIRSAHSKRNEHVHD